jgi:hypothetical protein
MYTVDVIIALEEGEEPTPAWWLARFSHGAQRAGAMPAEVTDPALASLWSETDPDTGDRFARVTMPLPPDTVHGRARELAHMLTSILTAEGWTLRKNGERDEELPGTYEGRLEGTYGDPSFTEGRVNANRCMACVLSGESRIGCCTEGAAFSLADIGAALLAGNDELVTRVLTLPGEMDGVKWHPYLGAGRCVFHDRSCGCTLPRDRMPLQCRTFLCLPEQLLPPELLVDYNGYVDALEEAEAFIEEHMHDVGGVNFRSPLDEIRAAAAKAFAAWEAGTVAEKP